MLLDKLTEATRRSQDGLRRSECCEESLLDSAWDFPLRETMLAGLRPLLGVVVPEDSMGEVDAESEVEVVAVVVDDAVSVVLTDSVLVIEELVATDDTGLGSGEGDGEGEVEVDCIGAGEGDRDVFHGLRVRFANDGLEKAFRVRSVDTLGAAVTSTLGLTLAGVEGVLLEEVLVLPVVSVVVLSAAAAAAVVVVVVAVGVVVVVAAVVPAPVAVLLLFFELRSGRRPAFSRNEACRRILLPVSTSMVCVGDCESVVSCERFTSEMVLLILAVSLSSSSWGMWM